MKKAIIIDDEPLARAHVRDCLKKFSGINIVAECLDGFEGVKAIQNLAPDIVFLDIQMPRINGFEMLELLETKPLIIFTTAFDEYALRAFEANALDYLLKPFSQERFDKAMQKLQSIKTAGTEELNETVGKSAEEANRIVLRHNGEIRIIPAATVMYIEAWDDYVKIHCTDNVYVKKKTLSFYENSLNKNEFIRSHRSFLVNVSQISAIDHPAGDQWELRLKNGFHLPVSRQGYARIKALLSI